MSNSDIKTQLENNFMKAFRDNAKASGGREYSLISDVGLDNIKTNNKFKGIYDDIS